MKNLINLLNNLQLYLDLSKQDIIYLITIFLLIFIITILVLIEIFERSHKRKQLETELQEEIIKRQKTEEKFRAIFNQTFQFIGLLDLEGNLLEANETALNMVGVKAKDVIGKPFWETPWWSHSSHYQAHLKTAIKEAKKGNLIRFETIHFDKDNKKVSVDFSLKPVKDEQGKIIFLIPEGRDITSLKKAKKKLKKNEQELEAIFDLLPDLFFRMKSNSIILEYRGSQKLDLYVSPEVFLGKSMLEILPNEVSKKWEKAISDVFKFNSLVSIEYSLSIGKSEEYYEARLVPFTKEEIIAIVRNITQEKRTELQLKKSKKFLQTIIDYLPVAIFVKDGKPKNFGQLLLVNKAYEDIFGLYSSQVIGKTGYDLFPLEQAKFYQHKDQQAFIKGVPENIPEKPIDSYNKGRRTIRTVKVPLYDEQNNPEYLVCITEDITQRKQAENELKKSNKLLQAISLAQSKFIADALPNVLFNDLLENFLNLTESEYGFIGEIFHNDQGEPYLEETYIKVKGKPYLKIHALTNIAWNKETRKFYDENAPQGMEFHNLKTLFGAVITTGKPVIANDPSNDPRRGGLPPGHPSLTAFLGLPFYHDHQLVGMVGVANRQEGYNHDLIDYLKPFLTTSANLIKGYKNEWSRQQAEQEKKASENKLKALLKHSSDIVSIFDTEGQLIYNSPAAEKIYGFSFEEMQHKRTFYLIHPEDRTRVGKTFSTLLNNPEESITVQYRYQTKSGEYIWIETVASNQLHNPNIQGIVANSRDISARKQKEEEIKRLNEELEERVAQRTAEIEMLLNTLPDYIVVVERYTMRFLFCNQIFAKGIGFANRNEVEGKTIFDCFPGEMSNYFAAQNQQVFNSGDTLHLEETIALSDGDHHFDTYKVPLTNSQGDIYALLGTSRDITELVQTKRVLMEKTNQLEATNQELDSFCYSVSHDLRAPLRHINGFVNALKQKLSESNLPDDPKIIHYLNVIEKSSEKMANLIDGLLTLSRVGRRELVFHQVNLNSVVTTAINMVSSDDYPIDFKIGKLPIVSGDAALLQQVFINLLENSIKFSRERDPIEIEINTLEDGTIFIADNGVGFDMQYTDQLFGAFQRLHSQKDFEGTGIGLSIVQRIIHRHGGYIWAKSALGEGATFYLKLT